jgi:excisionase family DNA binding protein
VLKSVKEAAQRWGVRVTTARIWLAQGKVTYVRLGRTLRISEEEIERLIVENTVPARERSRTR